MLEEIVRNTYSEVRARENARPLASFQKALKPSVRSFLAALKKPGTNYICEVKSASPSKGVIRPSTDVLEIAKTYEPFASAISVLTDKTYFHGSHEKLQAVSEKVSCPVLCKDFVVSPYQVYEARLFGADAILLMLSVLSDADYEKCRKAAHSLGMEVLTEIHSEEELARAIKLQAKIIGINNRNLKTLQVDINTCIKLAPRVPKECLIVAESGYGQHEQIRNTRRLVHAFLVGTAFMKKDRVDVALRELMFGRVKICGIRRIEDAEAAYACGAMYGGLNFVPESLRCVDFEMAQKLVKSAPLIWGGVFVDQPVLEIATFAHKLQLAFVQLHGEENAEFILSLKQELPKDCEVWKAVRISEQLPNTNVWQADRLLFDTYVAQVQGGSGASFDWSMLASYPDCSDIILAGGLRPENIEQASAHLPFALDIASGVEEKPGIKSHTKMEQLFSILKNGKE